MRIAYITWGNDPIQHQLARAMIASARKHMPEAVIVQETDDKSPIHPEADEHLVVPRKSSLLVWARSMDSMLEGETIFVDTDVVFRADVSDLFRHDFDVALCRRTVETPDQPWMGGFYASRSSEFWRSVVDVVKTMSPEDQEWYASQKAIKFIFDRFKMLELDARVYNCRPRSLSTDLTGVKVLHFRGRKPLMLAKDWSGFEAIDAGGCAPPIIVRAA